MLVVKLTFQQCSIHKAGEIYDNGHFEFLSQHTPQTGGVHQNQLKDIPDEVINEYKLRNMVDKKGTCTLR